MRRFMKILKIKIELSNLEVLWCVVISFVLFNLFIVNVLD